MRSRALMACSTAGDSLGMGAVRGCCEGRADRMWLTRRHTREARVRRNVRGGRCGGLAPRHHG